MYSNKCTLVLILCFARGYWAMEENRLDDDDLEGDDGLILSEEDILQVIELGDDEPMNGTD